MSDPDLDLIREAAQEAGALALKLRREGLEIEYKAADASPVTNADLAADDLLRRRLMAARPGYGWLSEETADNAERRGREAVFVVDPIDGTRAFLKNRPWWAVSVAVVRAGRPTAGVVFAPQLGETYAAAAGRGATLNGRPIQASRADALEDMAMLGDARMFGHPDWPQPWPPMRIESRSSTAYRMCLVGAGAFDAAVAMIRKFDWDLAAADLIAGEAGAFVGDHLGRPFAYNGPAPWQTSLVCAANLLAPLILNRLGHIALES